MTSSATAFAPASVGNVGIGFDILGFAVDALGDRVTVTRVDRPGVRILSSGGVICRSSLNATRQGAPCSRSMSP
jgi:homoserine kinase